jgi:hypothetical protein
MHLCKNESAYDRGFGKFVKSKMQCIPNCALFAPLVELIFGLLYFYII